MTCAVGVEPPAPADVVLPGAGIVTVCGCGDAPVAIEPG